MVRIGIAGSSGYAGVELIHILLRHPQVEIVYLSSQQHAGKKPEEVYPNLRGFLDIPFTPLSEIGGTDLDVLFMALPHGQAMKIVGTLPRELVIIDLSGDFRISDPDLFERFYRFPQTSVEEQKRFVYGLTEVNREKIRAARRVSNPGCFATATILALHPLFQENWIRGPVFVDAKTGSSGAGHSHSETTHHPRRSNSLFAYRPFQHQHLPEIMQALEKPEHSFVFQTYSAPFVRGIFASHYMQLVNPVTPKTVAELYQSHYASDFFVRWFPGCPDVTFVRHSNFVDIGAATRNGFLIVWSVLDNLQKGAAGQAVQNLNLMFGFPEKTALDVPPAHP